MTSPSPTPDLQRIPLATALRVRLLGSGLVLIGLLVALGAVVTWVAGLSGAVVSVLVVLALLGVLGLGLVLGLRHWVVRLDADGYRVRGLRVARAKAARWNDVLDLRTTTVGGTRCVVLRLRDGRTTTLPVDVLEGDPDELTRALSAHLDRSHGYRRLR